MSEPTAIDDLKVLLEQYLYNVERVDSLEDYLFLHRIMEIKLQRQHRNVVEFLDGCRA